MKTKLNLLYRAYQSWLAAHPWVAGLIVAAEGAAFGTIVDALGSGGTPQHLKTVVISSVLIAIRNYLKASPLQLAQITSA